MVERAGAIRFSATESTSVSDNVGLCTASNRMGASAGFALRYVGGVIPSGRRRRTPAMADCTSAAAASMLRLRLNWMVIWLEPDELRAVMLSTEEIVWNCLISGVATESAMVAGEAPGSEA